MDPFAVVTIKLTEDNDPQFVIQWTAISTKEHKLKLLAALTSLAEITAKEIAAEPS
jgi:hypothetical protein